jgi:hypothetical protein
MGKILITGIFSLPFAGRSRSETYAPGRLSLFDQSDSLNLFPDEKLTNLLQRFQVESRESKDMACGFLRTNKASEH